MENAHERTHTELFWYNKWKNDEISDETNVWKVEKKNNIKIEFSK